MTRYKNLPLDTPELGSTFLASGPNGESENYSLEGVLELLEANSAGFIQNNKLPSFYPTGVGYNKQDIAFAINNSNTFTVAGDEILHIINRYEVTNGNTSTLYTDYYFLAVGKGIYGVDAPEENELDVNDFINYKSEEPIEIVSTNNLSPKIEFLTVPDNEVLPRILVDGSIDDYEVIDGRDTFFVISNINSSDASTNKTYRFVGPSGNYGFGGSSTQDAWYTLVSGNTNVLPQSLPNELLSGGVVWDSGLTHTFTSPSYRINNTVYNTSEQQITLTDADVNFSRIDVFFGNDQGVLGVKTGVPSANPVKPELDLSSEIEISFAIISEGANTPDGVSEIGVWNENVGSPNEYDASLVIGTGVTIGSDEEPRLGVKSIELKDYSDTLINFTKSSPQDVEGISHFRFSLFQVFGKGASITARFYNGNNTVGNVIINDGDYNYNVNDNSDYQEIVVPVDAIQFQSTQFDRIGLRVSAGSDADGSGTLVYIDYLRFVLGSNIVFSQSSTFTGAPDTPNSYKGQGGKVVTVKDDETGLDFGGDKVVKIFEENGDAKFGADLLLQDSDTVTFTKDPTTGYLKANATVTVNGSVDGNATYINRGNTTEDVDPTSGEIADPQDGDTAIVNLTSGKAEYWNYTTAWNKAYTIDYNGTKPVTSYASQSALLAEQANHKEGYAYYDGTNEYVYNGTPTGSISDYRLRTSGGGEQNVQSDWNQTDNTQDDFIKNKPIVNDASLTPEVYNYGYTQDAKRNYEVWTERIAIADGNETISGIPIVLFRIPTVQFCANGDVLIACEAREGAADSGKADLFIARLRGDTILEKKLLYTVSTGINKFTNPNFLRDGNRIYLFYSQFDTNGTPDASNHPKNFYTQSDDHGVTFAAPVEILPNDQDAASTFKYIISPGTSIKHSSGNIIIPFWGKNVNDTAPDYFRSGFLVWDGTTFTKKLLDIAQLNEPTVFEERNGGIVISCRRAVTGDIQRGNYVTYDLGDTFTEHISNGNIAKAIYINIKRVGDSLFRTEMEGIKGSVVRQDLSLYKSDLTNTGYVKIAEITERGEGIWGYGVSDQYLGETIVISEDDPNLSLYKVFVEDRGVINFENRLLSENYSFNANMRDSGNDDIVPLTATNAGNVTFDPKGFSIYDSTDNAYLEYADNPVFDLSQGGTVAFMIKFDDVNQGNGSQLFLNKHGASGTNRTWEVRLASGKIRMIAYNQLQNTPNVFFESNETINSNEWYHVVAEFDGDRRPNVWINNVLNGAYTDDAGFVSMGVSTNPVTIGRLRSASTFNFGGEIGDVLVMNGFRTTEIEREMIYEYQKSFVRLK